MLEKLEKTKASIRAKVEHPFRALKRQFGYVKVGYRGLAKNTAQIKTLFALSNLWMVRKRITQGAPGASRRDPACLLARDPRPETSSGLPDIGKLR
jgi:hypothetical protein